MSEEPKTEAPKVTKEFVAVGEPKAIDIEREGRPLKEVSFQFGHLVTSKEGEDDKVAGRFEASTVIVVDGVEETVSAMAMKADKALDALLKSANLGSVDDWTFDLDDEYFEQKYSAPKVDENDFWSAKAFEGVREEVAALRDAAEEKAATLEDAKEGAQAESVELAQILKRMLEKCGNKLKVLESALRGPKGEGTNHPRMAKLGRGANAVREALRFAELTQAMFDVIPSSITSGKGLDTHKGRAISAICADVTAGKTIEWPADMTTKSGQRLPDLTSLGKLTRQLMRRSFGVEAAETDTLSIHEALDEAVDNAAQKVAEFKVNLGKQANTYDKAEYDAALMAYGRVLCIDDSGPNLLANAVESMVSLGEKMAADDAPADTEIEGIRALYNNNLLVKRLIDVAWAHASTVKKENEQRQLLQETSEDDSPISQTAAKKLAQLSTDQQAAYIVQMIARLPAPGTVFSKVKSLGVQLGLKDPETKQAAE